MLNDLEELALQVSNLIPLLGLFQGFFHFFKCMYVECLKFVLGWGLFIFMVIEYKVNHLARC